MASRKREEVFQLIKSLEKGEKRNFKLFVTRNSANQDLKIIQLFDLLDKMPVYDEALILKQSTTLKKAQLSNLKAHLYKQILASLRIKRTAQYLENTLHEQLEYAHILYERGLIHQSLRILGRAKELAQTYHQGTFLLQILIVEKKIETLHITRSMKNRAETLSAEIEQHTQQLARIGAISNASLLLYGRYIEQGHARGDEEKAEINAILTAHLPANSHLETSFYGRMYVYQAHVWYGYIVQDFLHYYRYAQKWVSLFEEAPHMKEVEGMYYLKGMHHLLQAYYMNGKSIPFAETIERLASFIDRPEVATKSHLQVQGMIYLGLSKLDQHFMTGTFTEGLDIVPELAAFLQLHHDQMDPHHLLLFYYKIACLYFGAGHHAETIDYLTRIINWSWNLRDDLQCYARLLHLITHYELEHFDILDSVAKSAYRFLAKMENLSVVEEEIFTFIRQSFHYYPEELPRVLGELLERLRHYENQPEARRAFNYLDLISWLESKLAGRPVQDIIREKYKRRIGLKP